MRGRSQPMLNPKSFVLLAVSAIAVAAMKPPLGAADGSHTEDDLAAARTVAARGLEKNQSVGDGGADQRDEVRAGATAAPPARQRYRCAP